MINNSNPIKWGFFAYDKHFLAMIRRAEKLTTNIGSYLSDFAIKTCTEAASVHASVHHYDSDDDDDDGDYGQYHDDPTTVLSKGSSFSQPSSEGNCAGKGIQARTQHSRERCR